MTATPGFVTSSERKHAGAVFRCSSELAARSITANRWNQINQSFFYLLFLSIVFYFRILAAGKDYHPLKKWLSACGFVSKIA
jgi:hypothetical protein